MMTIQCFDIIRPFFQINLGQPVPPRVLLHHLFWNRTLVINDRGAPPERCPSFHPAINVNGLKATKSINTNHWPGLILPSSMTGLLMEEQLLPLHQFTDTRHTSEYLDPNTNAYVIVNSHIPGPILQ